MAREYVRTQKHQETKHPCPSHMETEFCFQDTKTIPFLRHQNFPFPRHQKLTVSKTPKWNSISTSLKMKFCFHSTWNKILFPLHSKQNSVSGLHYSINPNTLLWYNDTHHCAKHLTWCLLLVIVIRLLPFTLLFLVTALLVFLPTLIISCLCFVLHTLLMM